MNSLFNIGGKVKIPTYLSPVRQCYSLRKAQKDYTGNIGIVKRMSDDATLTVGFNSNNELDTDVVELFNGNIAQASIYNKALTAEEILQNYNATKSRFGL